MKLLKQYAKTIAEETHTDKDSHLDQLYADLISIIGQKAAEMHFIIILVEKTESELTTYFDDIFSTANCSTNISDVDIKQAADLVRTSREVFKAIVDADEFERNFCRQRSRMPKTYFLKETTSLSTEDKADIFVLRFISKSKDVAKSVKPSLKRNSSFQSFGLPLTEVLERLEKRQFISSVNAENDQNGRMTKRYKVSYDNAKSDHKEFLQKFQYIYPGETFKKDNSIVH